MYQIVALTFHLSMLIELEEKYIKAYINGQVSCFSESLKESRAFINVKGNRLVPALSKLNELAGRYNRKTGHLPSLPFVVFLYYFRFGVNSQNVKYTHIQM